ncbi:MAG TPA: lipoate--protein ligase family protein [Herpetosiphon sp.]|uniref:Biotin/lipoate A/B protein ligase n=1 Tax=Herpetosiphon aurantiacus (strain ATCC 23779 / DSM 785 / 114-95) TaxID=316274 RepID=A9B2Q4_HERA2|nr:biotin/lipoate A/B protein ligase family protein [Herpetosiphon sp.]ABX05505.1 biotin/lipoate A/B protein ligase [Herpetosiphon aurantiacus DSM 785]HBW52887.1 lipoate--protein ligase family protein [Herpetosiphon sp.]
MWRYIVSAAADGATNMAIDHALVLHANQSPYPTLRIYRWQPACLSIGAFQPYSDVNVAACQQAQIEIVRRPTGGRAILHDAELTYSITAPNSNPLLGGRVLKTYRTISHGLLVGLRQLVSTVDWATSTSDGPKSAACFDTPSDFEITVAGRKLVGSAQTRTRGAILQHGTVLLQADRQQLSQVLHLPTELDSAALAERLIALDEAAQRPVSFDEAQQAIVAGFATAFNLEFQPDQLTEQELATAERLRHERYTNPEWLQRR